MVYIDLNMVRAGVVSHPGDWPDSGYIEIQSPPQRYAVINREALSEILGAIDFKQCQQIHEAWVDDELNSTRLRRNLIWSQNVAVGHKNYVDNIKMALGLSGLYKSVVEDNDAYALREPDIPYTVHLRCKKRILSTENTVFLE